MCYIQKYSPIMRFCVSQLTCASLFFMALKPFSLCCFGYVVQEAKKQLPLVVLKKIWGEAVSYICGLKEDYSRLFQGQRAAMWVSSTEWQMWLKLSGVSSRWCFYEHGAGCSLAGSVWCHLTCCSSHGQQGETAQNADPFISALKVGLRPLNQ